MTLLSKYTWLNSELLSYAETQEELFKKTIELISKQALEVRNEMKKGNSFEYKLFVNQSNPIGLKERMRPIKGEGYFNSGVLSRMYTYKSEVQEMFATKIICKYEELFGKLREFTEPKFQLPYPDSKVMYKEDVFEWIEKQLNGEAIKESFLRLFSPDNAELKQKKIIIKDFFYIEPYEYQERIYVEGTKELKNVLILFENGDLKKEREINAFSTFLNKEDIKKKWEIEGLSTVKYIKIYLNGKLEINFSSEEIAKNFFENYVSVLKN